MNGRRNRTRASLLAAAVAGIFVSACTRRSGYDDIERWDALDDVSSSGRICSSDNWCWLNPLPHGNDIHEIWSDGTHLFAVGAQGSVLHFDGSEWNSLSTHVTGSLRGVWASAPDDVYITGVDATGVLHYDGSTWTRVQETTQPMYAVWASAPDDVHVVGDLLMHYDGSEWSVQGAAGRMYDVWGTGPDNVIAVGQGGMAKRFDGSAWQLETTPALANLNAIWGTGPDHIVAAGNGGTIMHFDGSVWSPMLSPTAENLHDIYGHSPDDVYIVGDDGVVLHYDGTSWARSILGREALYGVSGFGPAGLVAMGEDGLIITFDGAWSRISQGSTAMMNGLWKTESSRLHTVAGTSVFEWDGSTLSPIATFATTLRHLSGTGPSDIHVVGGGGLTVHFDGNSWSELPNGTGGQIVGIAAYSPTRAFAVGEDGIAHRYDGTTWTTESTPTLEFLIAIWVGATEAVAVGSGGVILRHDGNSWQLMVSNTTQNLNAIAGTAANNLMAVGNSATPMVYDGNNWFPTAAMDLGNNSLSAVWGDPSHEAYVAGEAGMLFRWDGSAWFQEATGATSHIRELWGADEALFIAGDGGALLTRPR